VKGKKDFHILMFDISANKKAIFFFQKNWDYPIHKILNMPKLCLESFKNCQSNFLSVAAIAIWFVYFRQKGSAQSKARRNLQMKMNEL
jgi:hypothetical protein